MLSGAYGRPKPAGGLELWSWLFMRISGLLLLGLALGHLAIMHLINNVDVITYDFVAARYAGWFWRGYDLLMLLLALIHGVNGVRVIIDDYVHPRRWNRAAKGALYLISSVFMIMGIAAAVLFQPVGGPRP